MNIYRLGIVALPLLVLAACVVDETNGGVITKPVTFDGINFGTDAGQWANDYECDDPRFKGIGMTSTPLLEIDTRMDASDCLKAYKVGNLQLR